MPSGTGVFGAYFCVLDRFGLADDVDLDLAGVFEFGLDLLGKIVGEQDHVVLGDFLGLDHDADLAAGLDGVGFFDAGEGIGQLFELFEPADIVLDVLTACTGACSGDGVGRLHEAGNDGLRLDVAMVRLDGVDDDGIFLVLLGKLDAQLDVAALHLMVDGFAEVVQQACALGKRHVDAELGCHQARDVRDLDGVVQNVLTIGRAVFLGGPGA